MAKIVFKKLTPDAKIPTRGTPQSIGMDLYSSGDFTIKSCTRCKITTGVAAEVRGYDGSFYLRIAPRSGLAVNYGLDVLAGVVDADYRGEIVVVAYNTGENDVVIKRDDKIAQLIMEIAHLPDIVELSGDSELTDTARGSGGFGSTDQK